MKRSMGLLVGLLAAVVVASGCASTRITGEWRAEDAGPAIQYKKVFVTAITRQETVRRQVEDAFGVTLAARGAEGLPSYTPLPNAAEATEDDVRKAVKESGADAALIVRYVKKEKEMTISPGYYGTSGYYGAYRSSWYGFYEPPTVYQYDVVFLESKLYDVKSEKLLWAVSTETTDPGKLQKEIDAYAKLICDRLAEVGYLPASTK